MMLQLSARALDVRARCFCFVLLVPALAWGCSSSTGGGTEPSGAGAAASGRGGTGGAGTAGSNDSAGSSGVGGGAGESSLAGSGGSAAGGGSQARGGEGGGGEGGGSDAEMGSQEYGFVLRQPGPKNLDWLCTFEDGRDSGYSYVRLRQTGTKSTGIAMTPVYEVELAQLSLQGAVTALENVTYDYGGGHHNDSLSFDHGGKTHAYYHSSFGFGFRSCQAMDCRNVYALGTTTLETEGCASERALPEVCVAIDADGKHAPLVDQFMKCPGDAQ